MHGGVKRAGGNAVCMRVICTAAPPCRQCHPTCTQSLQVGRLEVLRIHTRNMKLDEDVDLEVGGPGAACC